MLLASEAGIVIVRMLMMGRSVLVTSVVEEHTLQLEGQTSLLRYGIVMQHWVWYTTTCTIHICTLVIYIVMDVVIIYRLSF